MKRRYIESLLLGKIVPEFRAIRRGNRYELVDGHQQLATILQFCADGFSTPRAKDDPRQAFLVEPNKRWSQLQQQTRDFFDNLITRIRYTTEDMEQWEAADLHRRLNAQRALSKIEKIWTYPSQTHERTKELLDHVFWQDIYAANRDRSHMYVAALYIMFLEVQKVTNISDRVLREFAAGKNDSLMSPDLVGIVRTKLDHITHLFAKTSLKKMNEVIPVYQAVQLLDVSGLNFKKSTKGCLTPWYQQIQEEFREAEQTFGKTKILNSLTRDKRQAEFWREHMAQLFETDGLRFLDPRRNFMKEQIREALERQRGLCVFCDRPIVNPFDGHHMLAYEDGGATTAENCAVLHAECHKDYHARLGAQLAFFVLDDDFK